MQKSTHCGLEFEAMATAVSCVYRSQVQLRLKRNDKKKKQKSNVAGIIKLSIYNQKVPIHCLIKVKIGRNTYSLSTTSKWSSARSSWARTRLVYVTIMRSGNHFGSFYFRSAFVTSASLYLKVPIIVNGWALFVTIIASDSISRERDIYTLSLN